MVAVMPEQMRFNALSELQKRQFVRACDAADVDMSEVLRDAMDAFIDKHTLGTDPDSLERQAIELEQTAEELRFEANELDAEREQTLMAAEDARREADQLRREASDLRASANKFEDDVRALAEYLAENSKLKVFNDHAKVVDIAQAHETTPEEVLVALVEAGVSEARVVGDV
jgi:predicted RNase H-like nuclease (RuvC/YqgF family)